MFLENGFQKDLETISKLELEQPECEDKTRLALKKGMSQGCKAS